MKEIQNRYIPPAYERENKQELLSFVDGEYNRNVTSLNKTGIVSLLSKSETLGVIGIDGKEYPMPTKEQLVDVFEANREVVTKKRAQGFTRLQLTPLALPIELLVERTAAALKKHARERKLFATKHDPNEPDISIELNSNTPGYIAENIIRSDQTGSLVYFPQKYQSENNHQGVTKTEVLNKPDICAIPGWSISLIEENLFLPRTGLGKIFEGRKQLENGQSPHNYLQALQTQEGYEGETGWTPEDFLTHFVTKLTETNQVSHMTEDWNVTWLAGTYLFRENLVPVANWNWNFRDISLNGNNPTNEVFHWGVRLAVRLGPQP